MSERLIKHMVERFLRWKLPEDFNPDCGISFKKFHSEGTPYAGKYEPIGTNLFSADQATEMVRYMVEGVAQEPARAASQTGVEALIKKWREEAKKYPFEPTAIAAKVAVMLCADELEVALQSMKEAEAPAPAGERIEGLVRETVDAWENFNANLPDGEYSGLGRMRIAIRALLAAGGKG